MINQFRLPPAGLLQQLLAVILVGVAPLHAAAAAPVFQWSAFVGRASAGSDDGPVATARFNAPQGVALDAMGNLYVADTSNCTIRKISSAGVVSTIAGVAGQPGSADGSGSAARFKSPTAVAVDSLGNVYVADSGNHTVRKITPAGGVTTIAGTVGIVGDADGPAGTAQFRTLYGIAVDSGGVVYVVDGNRVRRIANGQVDRFIRSGLGITVVDEDGVQLEAMVEPSGGMAWSVAGDFYFTATLTTLPPDGSAPHYYPAIMKRTAGGEISLVHGGPRVYNHYERAVFQWLAIDSAGNFGVLGANSSYAPAFWVRVRADGSFARGFLPLVKGSMTRAYGIALSASGDLYYSRDDNAIIRQPVSGDPVLVAGTPSDAVPFLHSWSMATDAAGNAWATAFDQSRPDGESKYSDDSALIKVTPAGVVTTAVTPKFIYPEYGYSSPLVAADGSGGVYFLHGQGSQGILTRVTENGAVTDTPIGLKPTGGNGFFGFYAVGFVADASGNPVVPDSIGHAIWRRNSDGTWAILAGKDGEYGNTDGIGGAARFGVFTSITVDRGGNYYVLDIDGATSVNPTTIHIRKITPTGVVTTIGPNLMQYAPEIMTGAIEPSDLAVDSKGRFYVTYSFLNSVWRLDPTGDFSVIGGKVGARGETDGVGEAARFTSPGLIAIDAQDRVLVIDAATGVMRRAVQLVAPVITTQPQSMSVATGGSAQFSVTATGTPEPTYQWNFNSSPISGATGASYSISGAQASNAGNYTVTVTNSQGSVTSGTATLTVTASGGGGGGNSGGSSGGGGGGGAPGIWFYAALAAATFARFRSRFAMSQQ